MSLNHSPQTWHFILIIFAQNINTLVDPKGEWGGIECRSLLKSSKKRQNQTVRKDNERNRKYEFLLILVCVYIYGHKFFPQILLFMHLFQIFFESHLYQWMHKCIVTDTCMNIPCTDLIDWGGIHPSTIYMYTIFITYSKLAAEQ